MMSNPFLILHKVRGLPAFDIAISCDDMGTDSDPGPWWIIPTSGHRAYPYWNVQIRVEDHVFSMDDEFQTVYWSEPEMPPSLPDHYSINDRQTKSEPKTSLISLLGLAKKIIRRI